ncbi:MAG: LysM peptidoglycan-binding domain-containing protein [Candidatus Hydrothermales bacterium]
MKKYISFLFIFLLFQGERVHIVKKGDTLWDIAAHYYGNPFFWVAIWKVNIDKIMDPHWIYPGQEFFIPEIPPIEGVLYPVYEAKVVERKPIVPREEVEIKVVAPPVPAVARDLVLSSGLIIPKNKISYVGMLIGSEEDKEKFFFWDKLYINKGNLDGIKVDDKFLVFKLGEEIKSKRRGISLGILVLPLGVIKVQKTEERSSLVLLEKTYEIIYSNEKNYFKEIEFPEIPTDVRISPIKDRKIEAEIVFVKEGSETEIVPFKIVFIDVGRNDGVKIGDLFEIYREGEVVKDPQTSKDIKLPYIFMGTVQVLNTSDFSSTCYVRSVAKTGIKVGDKVRLVGEVTKR